MLTKNDLQQIRGVVRDEISPVEKNLRSEIGDIKKDIKVIKSDTRYVRKSINLL